jgi:hypothetical protein
LEKVQKGKKTGKPPAKVRRWVGRRIIVDARFQFRMLRPFGVFLVIFLVLTGAFAFFPLYYRAANDPSPVARALLEQQLLSFHLRFWPMFIISILLACIYTLLRSNRVAGPLFKLKRALMQMTVGKYEKVRFRRKDEFREFEDVANRLALAVDSLSASAKRRTETLEKRLKFLKSRLEVRDLPKSEIMSELDDLIEQIDQVHLVGSGPGDKSEEIL